MGPDVEERLLTDAETIGECRSVDPSTKLGAIVTDPEGRILGTGYNGFPFGIAEDERMNDRALKYELVVHAEARALLDAKRDLEGCYIFVSTVPCCRCAALIIEAGITRVYANMPTADYRSRWGDTLERAVALFEEAGVRLILGGRNGKQEEKPPRSVGGTTGSDQ
jgi:dCMP deaminase